MAEMFDFEKDVENYKKAVETIKEIKNRYSLNSIGYDRSDLISLKADFIKKSGINTDGFNIFYCNYFTLKIVSGEYPLSNKTTHYPLVVNNAYMLLENGNVGRLSFIDGSHWNLIGDEWNYFRTEIEKLAIEYDSINSYWLFEPSESTIEKIKQIIVDTKNKVEIKLKEARRNALLKELEQLNN